METKSHSIPTKISPLIIALILLFVLLFPLWWFTGQWYEQRLVHEQKGQYAIKVNLLKNALEIAVSKRFALLNGLVAFAESASDGALPENKNEIFMSGLYAGTKGIRNFAIAPEGIVKHVYPLKGNENVPGHDLMHDKRPHVRKDVQTAIQTKKMILSGPYELRQGGLGLVARKAVYKNNAFWGLATMVIDMPPILKEAGFMEIPSHITTALREKSGRLFFGDETTFQSRPIILKIQLPDGYWELAGIPEGGWQYTIGEKIVAFQSVSALTLLLLAGLVFSIFYHNTRLKAEVEKKTHDLLQTNKKLKESEQRYANLFLENHSIMMLMDPDTADIVDANPAACTFYGYDKKKFTTMNMKQILPEPGEALSDDAVSTPLKQQHHFISRHRMATGDIKDVEIYSGPMIISGKNLLALVIHDISERVEAEKEKARLADQLRQAHKMEAIGTLAGGIAHDFNNILAAIIGYAELALEVVPDTSHAKKDIGEVIKAGIRARNLIKHIMAFSRKSGQEKFPLHIFVVVKEALGLIRPSTPSSIDIKQNLDPNCGNIIGEPTQIHQVVMNLCTNAVQAMDERGGILEIGLASTRLSEDDIAHEPGLETGEYVKISVRDTGPGIDENIINHIFEPYFTTKEVGKGSGMGLAVTHGIIKDHGGMVRVHSDPAGSRFDVFFPKTDAKESVTFRPSGPIRIGSEHVLVVDDEEPIAQMTKNRLEGLGYQVTAMSDSRQALDFFTRHPDSVDLVITDQTMPHLTGDALSAKLINIRKDIPIIMCTGYSSKVDKRKAKASGIKAFALKPLDIRELSDLITEVFSKKEP